MAARKPPSVLRSVTAALASEPGQEWQRDLAIALATDIDFKPNASMAAQLRALMDDIGVDAGQKAKDVSDDLASKRAARRAASG